MTSDAVVRERVDGLDVFDFGGTAVSAAPALERARIAIVTTAGLRTDGEGIWERGQGFATIERGERGLALAHASANFDRAGISADLNVAFPADRLEELAEVGRIGSIASRHLSFMGAQVDHILTTLRLDTGPAAAALLRDDGVDVVLLTPV